MLVGSFSSWVRIHQNVYKMYCSTEWWSCLEVEYTLHKAYHSRNEIPLSAHLIGKFDESRRARLALIEQTPVTYLH
jgi:hypothetical protein